MQSDPPNAPTLRGLLSEMREGHAMYVPILIQLDPPPPGETDSEERTATIFEPQDWTSSRQSREYAGHSYLIVGDNRLSSLTERPFTIGRSRTCDVRIENDSVSKFHASIAVDAMSGEYFVTDENSRNGTFINGESIEAGVRAPIWSGAHLGFGNAAFVFIDPTTLRKLSKLAP